MAEKYVDEHGNRVDPSELDEYDLMDVDFVVDDEVPDAPLDESTVVPAAPQVRESEDAEEYVVVEQPLVEPTTEPEQPMALGKSAKLVLLSAGVAVVAVVAGLAFGLGAIGNQNTVDDIKAAGRSKIASASSAVASKSSEVTDTAIDSCTGLKQAMADGARKPTRTLDVISSVPLPGSFIAARTNADGREGTPSLLQLTKSSWGAYTTVPLTRAEKKAEVDKPSFHKADVQVTGDSIRVTGDRVWAGGDQGGAGSCEPGEPGVYAATGKVPADAQGLVDGQASVDAIQGVAGQSDRVVALMGNSVVLVKVIETPAEPAGK